MQSKVQFFCFRLETSFLDKFGPKNQNRQYKLKFGTWSNWNMQDSVVMFTFSVFYWKCPFWVNLVQKIKIANLSWNLAQRLIQIRRIKWWCPLSLFLERKYHFWANFVQKVKIVSLSWHLVPSTNSNMQNLMVLLPVSVLGWKYPFLWLLLYSQGLAIC